MCFDGTPFWGWSKTFFAVPPKRRHTDDGTPFGHGFKDKTGLNGGPPIWRQTICVASFARQMGFNLATRITCLGKGNSLSTRESGWFSLLPQVGTGDGELNLGGIVASFGKLQLELNKKATVRSTTHPTNSVAQEDGSPFRLGPRSGGQMGPERFKQLEEERKNLSQRISNGQGKAP